MLYGLHVRVLPSRAKRFLPDCIRAVSDDRYAISIGGFGWARRIGSSDQLAAGFEACQHIGDTKTAKRGSDHAVVASADTVHAESREQVFAAFGMSRIQRFLKSTECFAER